MKKRAADRRVAWLGVLVAVAGSGCSDLSNYVDKQEAGAKDGGKAGEYGGRKDGGGGGKAGGNGSSKSSGGGAGGSSMGGQISSSSLPSSDAGVDVPITSGGFMGGASSGEASSGGAGGLGGSSGGTTPASSGGTTPPASAGGSNSRDAGYDLAPDRPVNPTVCTTAATCPGPTGGNGSAVCQNGQCGIACNTGYHRCNNACLADDSLDSCGSSCSPCSKPASSGSATCSGSPLVCGIRCDFGFHACGTSCVVNGSTSMNSCGNTCAACTAPANGSATCNGRNCVQACNNGYHLCNNACIPNNSVEGCGTASCTACRGPANGSPTCNGTSCGFECNSNYHKCGSNCASNTDPNNCGSTCKVCPGDANGTAACVAGDCAVNCKSGFHWCANVGRCVANSSTWPGSCGNNCTVCPTDTGAVATCDGSKCGLEYSSCQNDLALCGTDCVVQDNKHCGPSCRDCTALPASADTHMVCEANTCVAKCNGNLINCAAEGVTPNCVSPTSTSLDHCGGSCTPCPGPGSLGSATCTGTTPKCGIHCNDTAHLCDTTCQSKTDINHCGPDCLSCATAPDHADPACISDECSFKCKDGWHNCQAKDPNDPCKADDNVDFCGADCKKCDSDQICQNGDCAAATAPQP
jgi:hypothetical protein